jgi:hypothetical protein
VKLLKVVSSDGVNPARLQELVSSHISELTSKRGGVDKSGGKPMIVEVSMSVLQSRKSYSGGQKSVAVSFIPHSA